MNKKVAYSLIVIVLGLTAFVASLIEYSDSMLTEEMNTLLQKQINAESSMESVHFSLIRGMISARNLAIKDQKGAEKEYLLKINNISADVSPGELFAKKIEISILEVNGLQITARKKGLWENFDNIFSKNREVIDVGTRRRRGESPVEIMIKNIRISQATIFSHFLKDNKSAMIDTVDIPGLWRLRDRSGIDTLVEAIMKSLEKEIARKKIKDN
ncbi:MAG: hypothetical protein GTN70_11615 [Deltaproteobacteria bacterium]|nr:hypothetical protein [Deltaproteobacteria bacterium]NIS78421.1 hypothetical protein [Deltaproteobacteria bacterium]